MRTDGTIAGKIADAAAGPIGSRGWVESRAARMEGALPPLTTRELNELGERMRADAEKSRNHREKARRIFKGPLSISETGALEEIADFDDSTPLGPVESVPKVRDFIEGERVFHAICDDETGVLVDSDRLEKKKREKAEIREQSHAIAAKLQAGGVAAYRSEKWSLWTYGIHSGELEIIPQFRRICFIPYIAAAIREPHVRALEFWLQCHPKKCRFWTFTSGQRCTVDKLRERIQELHRRISQLNAADFMKAAGVEIVFRSTELGTVESAQNRKGGRLDPDSGAIGRDDEGRAVYHPHAHCIAFMRKGFIPQPGWSEFLARVGAFWVHNWQDGDDEGGPVRNARELCKYVSKPGDIEALTVAETVDLFNALRRLKLVQPMGALQEQIRAREEATPPLTLIRERTRDGFIWREIPNWNARDREPEDEHFPCAPFDEDEHGQARGSLEGQCSRKGLQKGAKLGTSADVDACCVVARCAPAASSCGLKEPRVVVMGKRWDAARVKGHPLVMRLRSATLDAWAAGLRLIRVHTGTPTVRSAPQFAFVADIAERVAPQTPPLFA